MQGGGVLDPRPARCTWPPAREERQSEITGVVCELSRLGTAWATEAGRQGRGLGRGHQAGARELGGLGRTATPRSPAPGRGEVWGHGPVHRGDEGLVLLVGAQAPGTNLFCLCPSLRLSPCPSPVPLLLVLPPPFTVCGRGQRQPFRRSGGVAAWHRGTAQGPGTVSWHRRAREQAVLCPQHLDDSFAATQIATSA